MDRLSRVIDLDQELYPDEAFARAVEAYAEYCDVAFLRDRSPRTVVITPRSDAPAETVDEFLSYMLGAALDVHLRRIEALA